jgi:hypothetical protein
MKILMALGLTLLTLASHADDVVPEDRVKDSINIRLAPDTAAEIVGRLRQGASLPLVNVLDGWYEVQLEGGATGFVSADWARVVAARSDKESPEAAPDIHTEGAVTEAVQARQGAAAVAPDAATAKPVEVEGLVEDAGEAVAATEEVEEIAGVPPAPGVAVETAIDVEMFKDVPADEPPKVVAGPQGPPGVANIKGSKNFLVKFRKETEGGNSQIFDDGNQVGIGTTEPKQRLEVNGSIQIHEQNSSVAGLMITQSSGETGYLMHNRASTLTIGAGSQDRITIDRDGNVGIGVSRPGHPLEMASGAHATIGGVWTNSSSRDKKENIAALSDEQAMAALAELEPVLFNYRNERDEGYVGFIAEDVPELVASSDRRSLSAMDIVAVLTKVVQAQERRIGELEARVDEANQQP